MFTVSVFLGDRLHGAYGGVAGAAVSLETARPACSRGGRPVRSGLDHRRARRLGFRVRVSRICVSRGLAVAGLDRRRVVRMRVPAALAIERFVALACDSLTQKPNTHRHFKHEYRGAVVTNGYHLGKLGENNESEGA
jgi:hypothetical protein